MGQLRERVGTRTTRDSLLDFVASVNKAPRNKRISTAPPVDSGREAPDDQAAKRTEEVTVLKAERDSLKAKLASVLGDKAESEKLRKKHDATASKTRREIAQLNAHSERLAAQVEPTNKRLETVKSRLVEKEAHLSRAEGELAKAKEELKRLRGQGRQAAETRETSLSAASTTDRQSHSWKHSILAFVAGTAIAGGAFGLVGGNKQGAPKPIARDKSRAAVPGLAAAKTQNIARANSKTETPPTTEQPAGKTKTATKVSEQNAEALAELKLLQAQNLTLREQAAEEQAIVDDALLQKAEIESAIATKQEELEALNDKKLQSEKDRAAATAQRNAEQAKAQAALAASKATKPAASKPNAPAKAPTPRKAETKPKKPSPEKTKGGLVDPFAM